MSQPAARQLDPVTGVDVHLLLVPAQPSPVPTPLPFAGQLVSGLSTDVLVNGRPAAVAGSVAQNQPPHLPPPGTSFSRPPSNRGQVASGSTSVLVNGAPMARAGDPVLTCNDPADLPNGTISGGSPDVMCG